MARGHTEPDYQRLSKILANSSRESFRLQVTFNNWGRGERQGKGKKLLLFTDLKVILDIHKRPYTPHLLLQH